MSGKRRGTSATRSEPQPGPERQGSGVARFLVFGVVLVVLAIIVIGVFTNSQEEVAAATAPVKNADRIDVVYFHRTERCDSCQWTGQTSRKTVESYFAAELASGKVTFREVDVQRPENMALTAKYGASGSSLFINYVSQGRDNIREAEQTYPYVGYEAKFTGLLRSMIAVGLGKS